MTDKEKIKELEQTIKKMSSINIPVTEQDIYDLLDGESFNWSFNGVDVFLYNSEDEEKYFGSAIK